MFRRIFQRTKFWLKVAVYFSAFIGAAIVSAAFPIVFTVAVIVLTLRMFGVL